MVSNIGKLKHELLFELNSPLKFKSDSTKLANAMITRYALDSFDIDDMKTLLELCEYWFEYSTDLDGKVTSKPRINWAEKIGGNNAG